MNLFGMVPEREPLSVRRFRSASVSFTPRPNPDAVVVSS